MPRNIYVGTFIAVILLSCNSMAAQVLLPKVSLKGSDVENPLAASPAQGVFNTNALDTRLRDLFPSTVARVPEDSLRSLVGDRASLWMKRVGKQYTSSMQVDNLGYLAAMMGNEVRARSYFDKRLATAGLSQSDRTYTLQTAFYAFSSGRFANGLEIARKYLSAIDSLGEHGLSLAIEARQRLTGLYYDLGVPDSVVKYGTESIELLARLPFQDRNFNTQFLSVADALVSRPNRRAEIERLGKLLSALAWPTDSMVAADSTNLRIGLARRRLLKDEISTTRLLGNPVPKIVGHYWLNTSQETGYREVSLADGKIRIVELGDFLCPYCLTALSGMQRLKERFVSSDVVEVIYVTNTFGFWGSKSASPSEEVEGLKQYYVDKRKLTFPISVWAPERAATEDGDFSIPPSPNKQAFFVTGTPRFCVTDAQGRLRRVFTGYSRDIEEQLASAVEYLVKEQHSMKVSSASPNADLSKALTVTIQ